MLRSDVAGSVAAAIAEQRAQIALPLGGGERGFGATFAAVRGEIERFIAEATSEASGSGASIRGASALSAEGWALRARLGADVSGENTDQGPHVDDADVGVDRDRQKAFVTSIASLAQSAAAWLGVDPALVVAHAALESGWGQRPLRAPGGQLTHNLFGLKAGARWEGEVAHAVTTEIEAGTQVKRREAFRSYAGLADAFGDYVRLLLDNPRYRGALHAGADAAAFARGLSAGGYATDPRYALKIEQVARQVRELNVLSGGR